MGGCQNYGPFLGAYYNTAPIIAGTQKGTLILTTTQKEKVGTPNKGLCITRWASSKLTVNPIKLETGLRPKCAGIPYTLLLRIEAMGFPTLGLLL